MGNEIRVVVGEGDQGIAVCRCGCQFDWNVPQGLNIIYRANKDKGADVLIHCPRCVLHSTIRK